VAGELNEADVYSIRRIDTQVMIPSGNTLVMGGLINDQTTKAHTKVPLLGDLPGIGLVFRQDSKRRDKANLLIFVTPTIVTDDDYQPTPTDFLKSRMYDIPDDEQSAWDSGKPHDWSRPVY
jgi:type II secretory pathway component GspD/PulD (secretin)